MTGRKSRRLSLGLLLAVGCAFPTTERVIVVIRETPAASVERTGPTQMVLISTQGSPSVVDVTAAESGDPGIELSSRPRPPNRLPEATEPDEEAEAVSPDQTAKPIGQFAPVVRVEAPQPQKSVRSIPEARPVPHDSAKPAIVPVKATENKVLAVGAPKGVDPRMLEPPPEFGRAAPTWGSDR